MNPFSFIKSKVKSFSIEVTRAIDQSLRRATGKPRAKRSMITPNLFLGGQYGKAGLETLKKWEITAVVSMRTEHIQKYLEVEWLKFLHLPTIDQSAPSIENLQKGVQFIDKEIKKDGKVYIHCRHGEGRGPSMLAAYLISQGMTLDDSLELIKKVRPFIRPTTPQLGRLKEFEALYAK